jgi:hypothetical protein
MQGRETGYHYRRRDTETLAREDSVGFHAGLWFAIRGPLRNHCTTPELATSIG